MIEGWQGNEYLILFEEEEISEKNKAYKINLLLPGHSLVALVGWDDFIIKEESTQQLYRVPTIPASLHHRKKLDFHIDPGSLRYDKRWANKIKWYIRPIAFGGDPESARNLTWISHREHYELVSYWNQMHDYPTSKNQKLDQVPLPPEIAHSN